MATTFTQNAARDAGFILSEENGQRSRENITIASGAGIVQPGTLLGKVTASGKYVPAIDTGATGQQVASALNIHGVDATSADVKVAAMMRDCEVNGKVIVYGALLNDAPKQAAAVAQLATAGIIVR